MSATDNGNFVEKHSTFWFEDGSIIIAANKKKHTLFTVTILFKIHKSILAKHSQVFCDMFKISDDSQVANQLTSANEHNGTQTPSANMQQTFEGLPVVEVHDAAEDWLNVLRTIYGESFMISAKKYNPDLELALLGPMRIAKKYEMDNVHRHLTSLVKAQWPKTLIEWDSYRAATKSHPELVLDPAAAIVLAFEHDIKRVLPVAFYLLSLADLDHEYGTEISKTGDLPRARWSLLSHSDLRKLMAGKEKIARQLGQYGSISPSNCSTRSMGYGVQSCPCQYFITSLSQLQQNHNADVLTFLDPNGSPNCIKSAKEENRKKFWKDLPAFFSISGIDSWI